MMSYSVAKVIIFSLPLPNNKEKSPHLSPPPPRLNATPRDRVGYAAAPAAAPRVRFAAPALGSPMPRLPPRPLRPLCPVGGGFAAVIPQASLPSRPLASGLPLPPVPHFFDYF